jgi:hypothetical protein
MDSQKPISPTLIGLSIVIVIQIAGFTLLWNEITSQQQYIYLPTENSQATTAGTPTNQIVAVTKFPTEAVLRDAIQSTLKQELGPYLRQLATAPEAIKKSIPADPPSVKENSPENLQAYEKVRNIVDIAIARGVWSMEDTLAASGASAIITENQRIELMNKIGNAITNQTMKLDPNAPPVF